MGDCCWSPWYFAGIPGVFEVPFELAAAGGPPVIGFPAVFLLLLASLHFLVSLFYLVALHVTDYKTIKLSDYGFRIVIFFLLSDYRNVEYRIGELKKPSDYRISDLGLNLSDYRISDSEKTIGCPPLQDTHYGI
jgi:hypothetical protein